MRKRNKYNTEKTEEQDNKKSDFFSWLNESLLFKLFKPVKILIDLHIKLAEKELKEDIARYLKAIISVIVSLTILFIVLLLINLLMIIAFNYYVFNSVDNSMSLILAILATIAVNIIFFFIFLLTAYFSFKRPFLKDTKKAIIDTLKNLR